MKPHVWNPDEYARNARYVSDLGMPALKLLNPRPGERILDLGCGDGELTRVLRDRGSEPIGIDSSRELIPRPTPLPEGMPGFLATFADSLAAHVARDQRNGYLSAVCDRLEPLLRRNGEWIADYVRLRFEATKE